MADGHGQSLNELPEERLGEAPRRHRWLAAWPVSAVCAVAVLCVLAALLLLMNLSGMRLGDGYDPAKVGSLAEWFEALATLIAVPLAVLVGVRQLQSTSEQIELGRQQLLEEKQYRIERQRAEHVRFVEAIHLRTYVANVLDRPDLASGDERADAERLRAEYRVRGWVPASGSSGAGSGGGGGGGPANGNDGTGAGNGNGHANGTWERQGEHRTNAELLESEPSPIVPKPWFAAVECTNGATATVTLRRWTMVLNGTSTTVESQIELRPGGRAHRRLGPDAGFKAAYAKPVDVAAQLGELWVQVDASDATDRQFQITALQE